jgi:cytochrome bd-type quinol oxidase subunit 2
MAQLRRFLGIFLLLIAPVVIYSLVDGAITHIDPAGKKDINNPVIWVIIIGIFLPIAIGLMIFGWYAFRGEYDINPEKNSDL